MDSFATISIQDNSSYLDVDIESSIPVNEDSPWRPGTYCVIA
ncbi:mating type pheromone [Serpula lacrymans var. lacrymans S7.9]|uniref:Mating type pheromone n=1 Tax=Serpula lacrymans var. lacrymans (strain S7.9) TaxID=578457 RepID=F8NKI6_SERL9|nr:mating type pheromone [Serpula lacrymans var. lacrymans S7.9]EGO28925.1 mating type pheromone [Serpula lacrymans var. lacrymans S7.9]